MEPGENLEHALVREVKEETGISVKNIRYSGSEPWPFPNSLMVGFTADFAGGELVVDSSEIESAFWFDREHLPRIPEKPKHFPGTDRLVDGTGPLVRPPVVPVRVTSRYARAGTGREQ